MTLTRIFWTAAAYIFMAFGILGAYLLVAWLYTSYIYERIYPLQSVNDKNGVVFALLLIFIGLKAFFVYRANLRLERRDRLEQTSFQRYYGD
jgi:membrane protein implicated in regulation of membrane protease activity